VNWYKKSSLPVAHEGWKKNLYRSFGFNADGSEMTFECDDACTKRKEKWDELDHEHGPA